jgi:hypothetical protein
MSILIDDYNCIHFQLNKLNYINIFPKPGTYEYLIIMINKLYQIYIYFLLCEIIKKRKRKRKKSCDGNDNNKDKNNKPHKKKKKYNDTFL